MLRLPGESVCHIRVRVCVTENERSLCVCEPVNNKQLVLPLSKTGVAFMCALCSIYSVREHFLLVNQSSIHTHMDRMCDC